MNRLLFILMLLLGSCAPSSELPDFEHWTLADKSIAAYRSEYPDKTVVFYMTAQWDVTGKVIQKKLEEERVIQALNRSQAVSFVYDGTKKDGLGWEQIASLGKEAYPNALVIFYPGQSKPVFRQIDYDDTIDRSFFSSP